MSKIIFILLILFLGIFEINAQREDQVFEVGGHRYKLTTYANFSGPYPAVAVSVGEQSFRELLEIGQDLRYSVEAGRVVNGIFYLKYPAAILKVKGLEITPIASTKEEYLQILGYFDSDETP